MPCKFVKLGEFKRTILASNDIVVGVQETQLGFVVIAQNQLNNVNFSVRHARDKTKPRTWRLDRLALVLKRIGIMNFRVRLNPAVELGDE